MMKSELTHIRARFGLFQSAGLFVWLVLVQCLFAQTATAQYPAKADPIASDPNTSKQNQSGVTTADGVLPLPSGPIPDVQNLKDDPAVREGISQFLQGNAGSDATRAVPGDMMDFIRGQKSMIKGSIFEPADDNSADRDQTVSPGAPATVRRSTEVQGPVADSLIPTQERFLAAELLLKSARRLDRIHPKTEARRELVRQMRREAGALLSDCSPNRSLLQPRVIRPRILRPPVVPPMSIKPTGGNHDFESSDAANEDVQARDLIKPPTKSSRQAP